MCLCKVSTLLYREDSLNKLFKTTDSVFGGGPEVSTVDSWEGKIDVKMERARRNSEP